MAVQHFRDPRSYGRLRLRGKTASFVLPGDPMSAEVDYRGPRKHVQQAGVDAEGLADRAELAPGRGDRTEVAAVKRLGTFQRGPRGHFVTSQQLRLAFRSRGIVGLISTGGEEVEHHLGQL